MNYFYRAEQVATLWIYNATPAIPSEACFYPAPFEQDDASPYSGSLAITRDCTRRRIASPVLAIGTISNLLAGGNDPSYEVLLRGTGILSQYVALSPHGIERNVSHAFVVLKRQRKI